MFNGKMRTERPRDDKYIMIYIDPGEEHTFALQIHDIKIIQICGNKRQRRKESAI